MKLILDSGAGIDITGKETKQKIIEIVFGVIGLGKDTDKGNTFNRWTPEDDAQLKNLIALGNKPKQISFQLKRTAAAISARINTLGLYKK